ncbi:MAG: class II glutamine amidotransferase [Herminiimonas sp.]|nr:class II glutamine amidotransferase [Herminiimonas sp.]
MNCNIPAAISFSFEGFSARGGRTDEHKDGWGIAFYRDAGCQLFTDHLSSITSPIAEQIKRNPIKSKNIIAHIRKATQGPIVLENSHPFMRELWGQYWTFAHNGDLKNFHPELAGCFVPVGETDSERAFCHMMDRLQQRFPGHACTPSLADLFDAVAEFAADIAGYGAFNFMLSNGEVLFAHCSTNLHYVARAYPFSTAQLIDCDLSIDFSQHNHRDDCMTVIATQPLTSNETWTAFVPGELKMFYEGKIAANCCRRPAACAPSADSCIALADQGLVAA